MKFCMTHWDALKEAIKVRGLNHLVSANGREAATRSFAELKGTADDSDFDPLMSAHNMIVEKAMQYIGLILFTGDYCPVCELLTVFPPPPPEHKYPTNELYFIDGPADAVLEYAQAHGFDTPLRIQP